MVKPSVRDKEVEIERNTVAVFVSENFLMVLYFDRGGTTDSMPNDISAGIPCRNRRRCKRDPNQSEVRVQRQEIQSEAR